MREAQNMGRKKQEYVHYLQMGQKEQQKFTYILKNDIISFFIISRLFNGNVGKYTYIINQ